MNSIGGHTLGLVGYHMNPATCGVARFNRALAASIGVEIVSLSAWLKRNEKSGFILSIKPSELDSGDSESLLRALVSRTFRSSAVILHEYLGSELDLQLAMHVKNCIAVDDVIADSARSVNLLVKTGFAPGMGRFEVKRPADVTLISMGMAHKINSAGYEKLSKIIRNDSRRFQLRLAAAVHEGYNVAEAFELVPKVVGHCWGGELFFLGFISDEVMSQELAQSHAAVLFGQNGARQSSSSILGAMVHGTPVITALDSNSSSWMKHGETVFDVNELVNFPTTEELVYVSKNAQAHVQGMTFHKLAQAIGFSNR